MSAQNESTPTPVWTPFLNLLRDPVFLTALLTAVVSALVLAFPGLSPYSAVILDILLKLAGLVIGSTTILAGTRMIADSRVQVAKEQTTQARLAAEATVNIEKARLQKTA
jgi:hypothetical protein